MNNMFPIKVRSLLIIFILALGITLFISSKISSNFILSKNLFEEMIFVLFYFFSFLFIYIKSKVMGVDIIKFFFDRYTKFKIDNNLLIVIPLILISIGSLYIQYYHLSFYFPSFIEEYILDDSLVHTEGQDLYMSNVMSFLFVCLIVPIFEEFIFRGYILLRWSQKWNVKKAAIFSSLLFGILHVDMIGALIFSLVVTIIFIKTASLTLPIFIHIINNSIAWIYSACSEISGEVLIYGVEEFRDYWWIGMIALIISIPWLLKFFANNRLVLISSSLVYTTMSVSED